MSMKAFSRFALCWTSLQARFDWFDARSSGIVLSTPKQPKIRPFDTQEFSIATISTHSDDSPSENPVAARTMEYLAGSLLFRLLLKVLVHHRDHLDLLRVLRELRLVLNLLLHLLLVLLVHLHDHLLALELSQRSKLDLTALLRLGLLLLEQTLVMSRRN